MTAYILRRLLLILPTLLIILLVNFVIIQAAPGGPVEQAVEEHRNPAEQVDVGMDGRQQELMGHAHPVAEPHARQDEQHGQTQEKNRQQAKTELDWPRQRSGCLGLKPTHELG